LLLGISSSAGQQLQLIINSSRIATAAVGFVYYEQSRQETTRIEAKIVSWW
jgi:hypothetical protein